MSLLCENLLNNIYDAGLGETSWDTAIDGVRLSLGSEFASMVMSNPATDAPTVIWTPDPGLNIRKKYEQRYSHGRRSLFSLENSLLKQGWVGSSKDIWTKDQPLYTASHKDFLAKLGQRHLLVGIIKSQDGLTLKLVLYRSDLKRPFPKREYHSLKVLLPHLIRAFKIYNRMVITPRKTVPGSPIAAQKDGSAICGNWSVRDQDHSVANEALSPIGLEAFARALKEQFSLTPSEIRLSDSLAMGRNLREASQDLGITYESARSHLKRIFSKADVRRQAELIKIFERLLIQIEMNGPANQRAAL